VSTLPKTSSFCAVSSESSWSLPVLVCSPGISGYSAKSLLSRPKNSFPRMLDGLESDLRPGDLKLFNYPTPNDPCILVRTPPGKLAAYSQKCTHLSCAVYYSHADNRLECPCHEGYFSVEDGSVLQGPPPRPLPRIALEQRGNMLYAIEVIENSERS
jgi:nitrite reductase/ring-hydroxylating ferredoxin subunit